MPLSYNYGSGVENSFPGHREQADRTATCGAIVASKSARAGRESRGFSHRCKWLCHISSARNLVSHRSPCQLSFARSTISILFDFQIGLQLMGQTKLRRDRKVSIVCVLFRGRFARAGDVNVLRQIFYPKGVPRGKRFETLGVCTH